MITFISANELSNELRQASSTPSQWQNFIENKAKRIKNAYHLPGEKRAQKYLTDKLASLHPQGIIAVSSNASGIDGMAALEPLPWDTTIYEMKMGKIFWLLARETEPSFSKAKVDLLNGLVTQASQHGYQHLTARAEADDFSGLHALEINNFLSMDVQVTLAARSNSLSDSPPIWSDIKPYKTQDLAELKDLSASSYQKSRLYADPNLPRIKSQLLHEKWIENDCNGRAEKVWVAHSDNHPIGYIACLTHPAELQYGTPSLGMIDLITVNPNMRGQGVGKSLVLTALNWFCNRVEKITVKTQAINYPALSLYQRVGFRLEQAQITLHRSLPNQ